MVLEMYFNINVCLPNGKNTEYVQLRKYLWNIYCMYIKGKNLF